LEIVSVKLNSVSAGSEDFVADEGNIFQRFYATEIFADFGCRGNPAFRDDGLSRRNEMKVDDADLTSGGSGSFLARSAGGNP
jgi:hypothetical protein